jgi:hypothetical protein
MKFWGSGLSSAILGAVVKELHEAKEKLLFEGKINPGLSNGTSDTDRTIRRLERQRKDLERAIEIGGGWRAALYLQNGDIDWDLDVSLWPKDNQVGHAIEG